MTMVDVSLTCMLRFTLHAVTLHLIIIKCLFMFRIRKVHSMEEK